MPFLDLCMANRIEDLAHKIHKRGVTLCLTGARNVIRRLFITIRLKKLLVHCALTVIKAVQALRSGTKAEI